MSVCTAMKVTRWASVQTLWSMARYDNGKFALCFVLQGSIVAALNYQNIM